jgi:hypothetical protein
VLEEAVGEWFEEDDAVPFMMQVFQIREEKRQLIPAVTHVDGSGRLQTVSRQTNQRYHRLIQSFCSLTDVPMVLNTSFNEREPVVCKPQEALDCFLKTKMDLLVIGNRVISRENTENNVAAENAYHKFSTVRTADDRRATPSPSSPAPSARRYVALGPDRSARPSKRGDRAAMQV